MRIFLLTLVLACATTWAQDTPPVEANSASTVTVEGTVTNQATGEPVRGAEVLLIRDEPAAVDGQNRLIGARTDAAGHFSISAAEPGRYRLRASHNRYLAGMFGARSPDSPGAVLTLTAGQHVSSANISLLPSAVIQGRVVDENGDPMLGVEMSALKYARRGPVRMLLPHGRAQTDDRGEYRIFGLAPGNYYLQAVHRRVDWFGAKKNDNLTYLPTYYPGVSELSEATPIEAQAGGEIPVDFTLTRSPTVRITGSIVNPGSDETEGYNVVLIAPGVGPVGANINQDRSKFEIQGVAPGNYILEAQSYGPRNVARGAREAITVGSAPLDGIKLALSPPIQIRGTIRVDRNASINLSQLSLSLSEANPSDPQMMWGGRGNDAVTRDGNFELHDITPGEYRLEVSARGGGLEDWYTKAVHFGPRDVTDSLLKVTGGGAMPLDVVISPAGATIQGIVKDANDHPVPAATVVTVPQGKHQDRIDLYQTAVTDQQGFFKIRGAAPGEYKVFAWEDVENDAWFDADFMKNYESQGTSLSVSEWERSTLSLRVIPSSKK